MDGKPTESSSTQQQEEQQHLRRENQTHRNSSINANGHDGEEAKLLHGARRGLLKAIWQATVAPRFQSRPMDLDEYYFGGGGGGGAGGCGTDPDNSFYPSSSHPPGDGRQQRTSFGVGARSSGLYGIGAAAAATGIYSSIAISETYDNDESVTSNTVVETQPHLQYPYQHADSMAMSAALASSASSVVSGPPSSPPPPPLPNVPTLPQPMPPNLTASETRYLETLLQSDDLDSIRSASVRLADKEIFPVITSPPTPPPSSSEGGGAATGGVEQNTHDHGTTSKTAGANTTNTATFDADDKRETVSPHHHHLQQHRQTRRDSLVQQQLYELHEKTTIMPSVALRRMSSAGCAGFGCSPITAGGASGGGGPLARRRARFQSKPLRFDSNLGNDENDGDDDFYDHGSFVVHSESGESLQGSISNIGGGSSGVKTTMAPRSIRISNSLTQDDESSKTAAPRSTDLRNSKQKEDENIQYQNGDNGENGIQEEKSSKETMLVQNETEGNVVILQSGLIEGKNSKTDEGEDSAKSTIGGRLESWNPLKDVNEWIDGNEGIEVDDDGPHDVIASGSTSNPFKILGKTHLLSFAE